MPTENAGLRPGQRSNVAYIAHHFTIQQTTRVKGSNAIRRKRLMT